MLTNALTLPKLHVIKTPIVTIFLDNFFAFASKDTQEMELHAQVGCALIYISMLCCSLKS